MISAVIVSRDDNYGGNLHHRATLCLKNMVDFYDEVIYVDWKPFNNVSLFDRIKHNLPTSGKIKHIRVEKEDINLYIPECINHSIIETIGRNVGIRRATGDWIVSTNIDVICDRPDVNNYSKDCFYVGRRRDVPEHHHLKVTDMNVFRNELSNSNYPKKPYSVIDGKAVWDKDDIWSLVVCCGDFQIAHKDLWYSIKGFEESMTGRLAADGTVMKKANILGFKTGVDDKINVFHLDHNSSVNREPNEILPMNNVRTQYIEWNTPTNKDDWGMSNINFKTEII